MRVQVAVRVCLVQFELYDSTFHVGLHNLSKPRSPMHLSKAGGFLVSGLTGSVNSSSPFISTSTIFNWYFQKLAVGLRLETFVHDAAPFCGTAPSFATAAENAHGHVLRDLFSCYMQIDCLGCVDGGRP